MERMSKRVKLVRRRLPRYAGPLHALRLSLIGVLLARPAPAQELPAPKPAPPGPEQVLTGMRAFLKLTARPDGSFQPGADRDYEGMSDSAYSDLAPTAYAVVIGKTFG